MTLPAILRRHSLSAVPPASAASDILCLSEDHTLSISGPSFPRQVVSQTRTHGASTDNDDISGSWGDRGVDMTVKGFGTAVGCLPMGHGGGEGLGEGRHGSKVSCYMHWCTLGGQIGRCAKV